MPDNDFPYLSKIPADYPWMWTVDVEAEAVVDMTPATAKFLQNHDVMALPRTLTIEGNMAAARRVIETGEQSVAIEWLKFDGAWHKLLRTKSHVGDSLVLEVAQDITLLDPRAPWLARINLDKQRLELESGKSFSYDEWLVLHFLLKGFSYKEIGEKLHISPKTVEYRLSRLKDALEVETIPELIQEVSSSGLSQLAIVPIDINEPAVTEQQLYMKIPG